MYTATHGLRRAAACPRHPGRMHWMPRTSRGTTWAERVMVFSILIFCLLLWNTTAFAADPPLFTPQETAAIGQKIFWNETGGDPDAIAWWGAGEDFASVGIGHFLWMPKGYRGPFEDSFRSFLWYAHLRQVVLPVWLATMPSCPWRNRAAWLRAQNDPRMRSLKTFLLTHIPIQSEYIVYRFSQSVHVMLRDLPPPLQRHMQFQLRRLMTSTQGQYVLVDYVNFKGTGLSEYQKGNPHGWGLLQVLQGMTGTASGDEAVKEFADSAKRVLKGRVQSRPQDQKWLAGWLKRVDTYTKK